MKKAFPCTVSLVSGTLVLLANGVIYAWSIYSSPFPAGFGWTSAQLGLCFTLIMASFCLGGVLGSVVTGKVGSRVSIPAGGVLGFAGFSLCLFLDASRLWLLYTAFLIAGLGVGIVYNAVVSSVVALFPDKKGTASGIMMMGFGASSLVVGSAASKLIDTPSVGWHLTYVFTGALLLAAALLGTVFVARPAGETASAGGEKPEGMTTPKMLRTPQFWLYFLIAALGTGFGSGIIGHARYIALEAGAAESFATLTVGLISVSNGMGRILFGYLHDKRGFRVSLMCDAVVFMAAGIIAALSLRAGLTWPVIAALMMCGLGYGALPPIASSVSGEFFGRAHYATNYSVVNLSIMVGAFAASIAGAIQTRTGSYTGAFWLFTSCAAAAALLILALGRVMAKKH